MEYKEKIMEMINNINDEWILKEIYRYIKNMTM